jgi:hypothetical protein
LEAIRREVQQTQDDRSINILKLNGMRLRIDYEATRSVDDEVICDGDVLTLVQLNVTIDDSILSRARFGNLVDEHSDDTERGVQADHDYSLASNQELKH